MQENADMIVINVKIGIANIMNAKEKEIRKDDSNETTWYITISTNNHIISTYNNWFIPKLYGLFTIPVSTDKTNNIIIRKDDFYEISSKK